MLYLESHLIAENEATNSIISGNAAIARALIEARAKVITSYPGTPCAEVTENLTPLKSQFDFSVEWSINEKIAFEKAYAAATANLRSAFITKSVGMNTILDSLIPAAYTGITGGFVIISADDPGACNSPIEEDTRRFASFANIIGLMPSSVQEILDITKYAFSLSEQSQLPILITISSCLLYTKERINLHKIDTPHEKQIAKFKKTRNKWVFLGKTRAVNRHQWLIDQQPLLAKLTDKLPHNLFIKKTNTGIITCGNTFQKLQEILKASNLQDYFSIAKIVAFHPIPRESLQRFLAPLSKIIILEELEPIIEQKIRALVNLQNISITVLGKQNNLVPRINALTIESIRKILYKAEPQLLTKQKKPTEDTDQKTLLSPFVTFCPGCPHRKSLYILKKALEVKKGKDKHFIATDIGCSALGSLPPLEMGDIFLCMGASVNIAASFAQIFPQACSIAIMGDSTFFHSGIQGILDAKYRNINLLIYIVNNQTCAMTGQQITPGTEKKHLIQGILKASGFKHIFSTNPTNYKKSLSIMRHALASKGVQIIISTDSCIQSHKENKKYRYTINNAICTKCLQCLRDFGCIAIEKNQSSQIIINQDLCNNCGFCLQICPTKAIRKIKVS